MADAVRVRFLEDRKTSEEHPQVFRAGQVYSLRPDLAARWVLRKAAEYTDDPVTAPARPARASAAARTEKAAGDGDKGSPAAPAGPEPQKPEPQPPKK